MSQYLHKNIYSATFIAIGVGLGFSFASIPNVEMVTATIFISGYFLGIKRGILIGIITEALYSGLNPYGMAAPPLFLAQIFSMGLAGAAGGITGQFKIGKKPAHCFFFGFIGFALTVQFAILTTLSFVLLIDYSWEKMLGSFLYGLYFYAMHILTNVVIFTLIVPAVVAFFGRFSALARFRMRGVNI